MLKKILLVLAFALPAFAVPSSNTPAANAPGSGAGGGGGGDASTITYTPGSLSEWPGGTDPGNVDGALNALAANRIDFQTGTTDDPNGSITCTTPPCTYVDTNGRAIPGSNPAATTGVPEVWTAETSGTGGWNQEPASKIAYVPKYSRLYPSSTTAGWNEAIIYGCATAVASAGRFSCYVLDDRPEITITDTIRGGSCSGGSLNTGILFAGIGPATIGATQPLRVNASPAILWDGTETGALATMLQIQCSRYSRVVNLGFLLDKNDDGTNYARAGVRVIAHNNSPALTNHENNWSGGHNWIIDSAFAGSKFNHAGDSAAGGVDGAGGPAGASCASGTKAACMHGVIFGGTSPFDDGASVAEVTGQTFSVGAPSNGISAYQITGGGGSFGSYAAGDWVSFSSALTQARNRGVFQIISISTTSTANDTANVWNPNAVAETGTTGVAFAEPSSVSADIAYSGTLRNSFFFLDYGVRSDKLQVVNVNSSFDEFQNNRVGAVFMWRGSIDIIESGAQGPVDYPGYAHVIRVPGQGAGSRWVGQSWENYEPGQQWFKCLGTGTMEPIFIDGVRMQNASLGTTRAADIPSGCLGHLYFNSVNYETGSGTPTIELNLSGGSGFFFSQHQTRKDSTITLSPTIAASVVTDCEGIATGGKFFDTDCDLVKDSTEFGITDLDQRTQFALAANNFDAIADLNTQTVWRRTKPNGPFTSTSYAGNPCRAMQEALNYSLSVTSPSNIEYTVGWFGEATIQVASDYYDQGPYSGCVFVIPASASVGTGGTGGYSVNDANREGWPEISTTNVPSNLSGLTVTSATSNTLTDNEISPGFNTLSGNTFYIEITGGTGSGQKRRISSSTATQATVDLNWSVTPDATSVYRVFSIPILNATQINVVEDYVLTIDQTGQSEVSVFMTRGNGWASGYDSNGGNVLIGAVTYVNFSGNSTITLTNEVASTGWIAGEMPEASATTVVTPDRAHIMYLDQGYRRSQDSTVRRITSSTLSNDNIGYYTGQTWGLQRTGKGTMQSLGLAVKMMDNNVIKWNSQYVSGVNYGVSLGEVPNGGDSVPWSSCLTGYCTPIYTGGTGGAHFEDWITESCYYGCWIHVDGGATIESLYTELNPTLMQNHDIIIGAVKCNSGNAATEGKYVAWSATNGDCGSGGAGVAHSSAPVTQMQFTGNGFSSGFANTHTYAGIIIGDGASQSKGYVLFGKGFKFGNETLPANDANCTGPAAPYWYCTGVGTSPQIDLQGPRFAKTGSLATVRIDLDNASRLTSEFVNGGSLWPYSFYKFPDTHTVEFSCVGCDLNANDVIGRAGGFIPDGMTSETLDPYSSVALYPRNFLGSQNWTNIYIQKLICAWGGPTDGGESGESVVVRAFLYDSNSAPVPIGAAVTFTEPTDGPSLPKAAQINTNTEHFDFSSGTAKDYTGVFSMGLYVSAETDATDNNLTDLRCTLTYATLGDE